MRIAVVIPTLNEEAFVGATLDSVEPQRPSEVVVVDGGSTDRTVDVVARRAGRVIEERGGLGRQLNAGARHATAPVLLFLYADAVMPPGGLEAIERALRDERVVGGAFRLGLDGDRFAYRFIAATANLRNRFGLGPFGDQGIFVRRGVFEEIDGFRDGRHLEDLDLVRRLRRRGRFVVLPETIVTSVRRWEENGLVRTMVDHTLATTAWVLGRRRRPAESAERRARREASRSRLS